MKSAQRIVFAVLLLLGSGSASGQQIRDTDEGRVFEQAWEVRVQGETRVALEDLAGNINVTRSADQSLRVRLQIDVDGRSRQEALAWGAAFEPSIRNHDDTIWVEGESVPRNTSYFISIPDGMSATLESRGGTIDIRDLGGPLEIDQSGGVITVEGLNGALSIESDGGDVDLESIEGSVSLVLDGGQVAVSGVDGELSITTGGGGVDAYDIRGDASIITAGGNVELSGVTGDATVVTSAGRIEVDDIGGKADLSTGGGDIEVSGVGGTLSASSSGGDVEVDDVRGSIRIEGLAGDVELTGVRSSVRVLTEVGDIEIEVVDASFLKNGMIEIDLGHGDIDLLLPLDTHADVIANVQESGSIDVDGSGWDVELLRDWSRSRERAAKRAELRIGKGGGEIQITLLGGEIVIDHH